MDQEVYTLQINQDKWSKS